MKACLCYAFCRSYLPLGKAVACGFKNNLHCQVYNFIFPQADEQSLALERLIVKCHIWPDFCLQFPLGMTGALFFFFFLSVFLLRVN